MNARRGKRGESGVAMLMALVTLFLLSVLAGEIVYQSGVYSNVVFRQRDSLRAALLARSGLRLALLQLRTAKKARDKVKMLGLPDASVVDKIWQTPLMLPPPEVPGLTPSESGAIGELRKSLGLEGTVTVNIAGENARLSINQLVSPTAPAKAGGADGKGEGKNEGLPPAPETAAPDKDQKQQRLKKIRDSFREIFDGLLERKRLDDDAFREKYPSLNGERLVGHLLAWMDPETQVDGEGRDKSDVYGRAESGPYSPKNAPIASDSEYHMVQGIEDEIAKLIRDNFTTLPAGSVDVNKISLPLLQALIPELSSDALEEIGKRRSTESLGGPFKNEEDFWKYVGSLGRYDEAKSHFSEKGYTILGSESGFHAVITAESGMAKQTWLADIGPLPPKQGGTGSTGAGSPPSPSPTEQGGGKPPQGDGAKPDSGDTDSLSVIYLRTE